MGLIKRYPEGSDLAILDVVYQKPRRDPETDKFMKGYVVILYKDNITGKKHHEIIYDPKYTFYMANDDVQVDHNMFYIEREKVHPVECKYTDLQKTIAELTNNQEFFYENKKTGNYKANAQLHTIPTIFSSDTRIQDHYRALFDRQYTNDVKSITKGYFDIEVDSIHMAGDFPQLGECPVNAISYIDDKTNTINVLLLRDISGDNPQIQEFENILSDPKESSKLFAELKQFIIDNVGGLEKAKKFHIDNPQIQFMMYDDELELIRSFFLLVHRNQPDFMQAWNMAFDIPYLYERTKVLGGDPNIILTHPAFEEKYAEYYVDERNGTDYELRGDYYNIAGYTIWLDQLIQFASRRKGQAAFPNFKLDTAASIITKGAVRKLSYKHITTQISELPRKDYKTFVFYNIMDTIAQKCIEESVNDIDYVYNVTVVNDTMFSKAHRQTVYLTNRVRKFFLERGYVLGNNCNIGKGPKYWGALVHNPEHNTDYSKVKQNGMVLNMTDNSDDFDFKALYPSITRENHMSPDTIIGKIFIPQKVHDLENPYYNPHYDRGGQFLEDLTSGNPLEFNKRWFGLAGFKDMLDDVDEYLAMNHPAYEIPRHNTSPFIRIPKDSQLTYRPFMRMDAGETISPFIRVLPDKELEEKFKPYI